MPAPRHGTGPFRADQLPEDGRYELSNGHPVYCAPASGRHAGSNLVGALPLGTDPAATETGVDVGYVISPDTMRAPDIAVGNVPDAPGLVNGAPPLAVEYADTGQDERELRDKIRDLLGAGTRYVWVVRLTGPRRVEVHEPGRTVQTVLPGQMLTAPGVLQNALRVEALYDPAAAREATLTNLLQRKGYADLDAVKTEGEAVGKTEGLRQAIVDLCEVLGIPLTPARQEIIAAMDLTALAALRVQIKSRRTWAD